MKISPADKYFSKCVRARTNWTCECCGKQYEENSQGLHCSHYYGRRAYAVRYDPMNAFAHCFSCHQKLGSNPEDFHRWATETLGKQAIGILQEKRENIGLAKDYKKNLKDVAKHYREQFKLIQEQRELGNNERINFVGYI